MLVYHRKQVTIEINVIRRFQQPSSELCRRPATEHGLESFHRRLCSLVHSVVCAILGGIFVIFLCEVEQPDVVEFCLFELSVNLLAQAISSSAVGYELGIHLLIQTLIRNEECKRWYAEFGRHLEKPGDVVSSTPFLRR